MYFTWEYDKYESTIDKNKKYSLINEVLQNSTCYQTMRIIGNHHNEIIFLNSDNEFNIKFPSILISSKYFVDCYCITIFDYKEGDMEKGYYRIVFKSKEYYEKLS